MSGKEGGQERLWGNSNVLFPDFRSWLQSNAQFMKIHQVVYLQYVYFSFMIYFNAKLKMFAWGHCFKIEFCISFLWLLWHIVSNVVA